MYVKINMLSIKMYGKINALSIESLFRAPMCSVIDYIILFS